eukprot:gene8297-9180_t
MQLIMDCFSAACTAFGLTIIKKTKVMFTVTTWYCFIEPSIYVNGVRLEVVNNFVYLGSTMAIDRTLDAEITLRFEKASIVFSKLEERVWSDRDLKTETKIVIYIACVLSVLLYAAEGWNAMRRHVKLLERFHQQCLRRILNVKWQTFTPDTKILELAVRMACSRMFSVDFNERSGTWTNDRGCGARNAEERRRPQKAVVKAAKIMIV